MAMVNYFEAFYSDPNKPKEPLFTIIVPGDEEDPQALMRVVGLLHSGTIFFAGGFGSYESEDCV